MDQRDIQELVLHAHELKLLTLKMLLPEEASFIKVLFYIYNTMT